MRKQLVKVVTLLALYSSLILIVGWSGSAPNGLALTDTKANGLALMGNTVVNDQGPQAQPPQAPASAPNACTLPKTETIRGKSVEFDLCYERTFTDNGTSYTLYTYYIETNTATHTNECDATENSNGRCEHALSDNDDSNGDNVNAVAMAAEVEGAIRFYNDRNLDVLPAGVTDFNIFIAEDPRGGGIVPANSIYCDDELLDSNDVIWKRLLAYHEIQHLVQDKYDDLIGWDSFYGEGIARAIEDRLEPAMDADTGHLFIPEVDGILSSDTLRTSDIATISYSSVLWWTWLMDRYTLGSETEPVQGWSALRDFYLELKTESSQVKAIKDFVSSNGSNFNTDFTDYTLAMYADRFNPSDPRIGFLDTEIGNTSGLRNHNIINSGPNFSTSSQSMNPRSSRYWEFTPANQCEFIAFSFDGNGKNYGFSVMTVDGGTLDKRWTSYSDDWSRTVRSADLDRVVGVVTAIDNSGTVDVGRGCVKPTIDIKSPTTAAFKMVGLATNPRHFITRLSVKGEDNSGVAGLVASDFQVQLRKAGGGPLITANVVNAAYVQDDYWLLVQAPSDSDGAENGIFYDLIATLGTENDTEASAVLYVERTQDVVVVLDRSGSMGGTTGKIEAARNAANLLINELTGDDQGSFVAFDQDADLREGLDAVAGTHRTDLFSAIANEMPGGNTSIGDGLEKAASEEDSNGIATNLCSFVLLSDGHENSANFWADIKGDVMDNGCAIHSIALGPGTNETLMQEIAASVPGGTYDYATADGGVPIKAAQSGFLGWENNLGRIYDFKTAQMAGRQRLTAVQGGLSESGCANYDDLGPGNQYSVDSFFYTAGIKVTPKTFFWSSGTATNNGIAVIETNNASGGSGNDIQVNNINLDFDFGGPVAGLSLQYGEYGGNLNIEINGDFRNFSNFAAINGQTIGGVVVTNTPIAGTPFGRLTLQGTINSFAIGGQELWIDNVCPMGEDGLQFYVDDASDQLVVAIGWQNDSKGKQSIQLFDPDNNPADVGFRRREPTNTNEVWDVPQPKPGFWRVEVKGLSQEYFVSATALTRYEMYLFIGSPISSLSQGAKVPLLATFVGKGEPLTGATVVATVQAPNGQQQAIMLLDDGNHGDAEAEDGIYGGFYHTTNLADNTVEDPKQVVENEEPQVVGSYLVNVVGTKGDLRREAQGSFAIKRGDDQDQDRIPDEWERENGLDPDKFDSQDDPDRDKLSNYCEYLLGTNPFNSDTDDGGEMDGSETNGQCVISGQDPLNPTDDRVGPITSVIAKPELADGQPVIHVKIGQPTRGDILQMTIYRRVFSGTDQLLQDWTFFDTTQDFEIEDTNIQPGMGYAYLVEPLMDSGQRSSQAMTSTGRLLDSGIAVAKADPYPPSGSIIINNNDETTDSLQVTLNLAVDDSGEAHDGAPDNSQPGSPASEIMMRLSNGPNFEDVPWQAFQPEVTNWDLGDVSPAQIATVRVQFKDAAGNVNETGFAQADTIQYRGNLFFLPVVQK